MPFLPLDPLDFEVCFHLDGTITVNPPRWASPFLLDWLKAATAVPPLSDMLAEQRKTGQEPRVRYCGAAPDWQGAMRN